MKTLVAASIAIAVALAVQTPSSADAAPIAPLHGQTYEVSADFNLDDVPLVEVGFKHRRNFGHHRSRHRSFGHRNFHRRNFGHHRSSSRGFNDHRFGNRGFRQHKFHNGHRSRHRGFSKGSFIIRF